MSRPNSTDEKITFVDAPKKARWAPFSKKSPKATNDVDSEKDSVETAVTAPTVEPELAPASFTSLFRCVNILLFLDEMLKYMFADSTLPSSS